MSKALKVVGTIAGVVGMIAGGPIGAAAMAVAAVANVGAQLLAKPPPAVGAVNSVLLQPDAPSPYVFGRTFFAGVMRHDVGYGGRVDKVHNPYRGSVFVYSVAGPIGGFESFLIDYVPLARSGTAVTGYYNGFLWIDARNGNRPDTALTPRWAGMPGWSASHRLSGKASALWSFKFDKEGKVFASGVGAPGVVMRGTWAYDPRKDSTYLGGIGSHRWDDELSWEWTENPALVALTYARGRFVNGRKVMGVGLPRDGIAVADFAALANVCDANGWTCGGTVWEPGNRKENLDRILWAAGATATFSGARLVLRYDAPRVAIDTITLADIADGEMRIPSVKTWRERLNTLVPKYRSEAHKWEMTPSAEVSIASFVAADGEVRVEEDARDFVQDKDQAAQLSAYRLLNSREVGPVTLPLMPRFRHYGPGDMFLGGTDLPLRLRGKKLVMIHRQFDPMTMQIVASFETDTPGKHDYALGRVGASAPIPLDYDPTDVDEAAVVNATAATPAGFETSLIAGSWATGASVEATDNAITVSDHVREYSDKAVAVTGATLTGLSSGTVYGVYYDDPGRVGGAVTYVATEAVMTSFASSAHPNRHHVGTARTGAAGEAGTGDPVYPPGYNIP